MWILNLIWAGDIIKELADECQKQGIKLHFYYSHLDWRREDYPVNNSGRGTGRVKGKENWESYYKFMNNQLTELLTNYGPIGAIWFDGVWDNTNFDWQLEEQYAMIHKLQPSCLVGNNHHRTPTPGEDFQMFERDLPGENKAGYSAGQEVSALPLETCETMNGMWGYKIEDQNYKSTKTLIQLLVRAAGKSANLLMNIGPQPNGELPAVAVQRMKEMGEWMQQYGETIYGTRGGDVAPHAWGVSTRKGNRLFIHVLDLKDNSLYIPLKAKVKKAVSNASNFDKMLTDMARAKGCDGVICGHIHRPEDRVIEGIHYLNSGDWVETLSGLAEDLDGKWKVVYYKDIFPEQA